MKIRFLQYFKRAKAAPVTIPVVPPPIVTIEKPASERFGKTVLPNVSRFVGVEGAENFPLVPPEGFEGAMPTLGFGSPGSLGATAVAAAPRISLGASGTITAKPNLTRDETAVAIAERKIELPFGEILPQIPANLVKSGEIDPEKRILLKGVEVERGMASGRPAASLRSIYQQAPELFAREVAEDDPTQVALPLEKVIEQFASFQVRSDQVRDDALPQLETPFFQLTKEDGERFGNSTTSPVPSVPGSPAAQSAPPGAGVISAPEIAPGAPMAAKAIKMPVSSTAEVKPATGPSADTPPVSAPAAKPIAPIRLPALPRESAAPKADTPAPQHLAPSALRPPVSLRPDAPATPQVPDKISPNGMGAPASERVPASSGPPVPTAAPAAAPQVAFKVTSAARDPRQPDDSHERPFRPAQISTVAARSTGPKIQLPLRSILSSIAPFQLSGPPLDQVPDNLRIELPFAIVAPQLALGRIQISPAQLQAALPAEWREKFTIEDPETPIPLPLQEVLQNLPNDSLQIRADQEQVEVTPAFETPFSQKAAEDAARLPTVDAAASDARAERSPDDSAAKPQPKKTTPDAPPKIEAAAPQPAAAAEAIALEKKVARSKQPSPGAAPATASPLRVKFDASMLDAKAVVAQASKLDGVQACAVVFSDGLSLAGNIPAEYEVDGICAIAPAIVKRLGAQMASAKLGVLSGITLFCAKAAVTFFAHGNICLAALHSAGSELTGEIRTKLDHLAEELSRTYATPA